jgi:hypothetical protein
MTAQPHTASDEEEQHLRYFGRHFLCMGFVYIPIGSDRKPIAPPGVLFYSSTVADMFGSWWLVTAGHIIKEIETRLQTRQIEIQDFRLLDHFGMGRDRMSYPVFDYVGARKFYEYDDARGIDWGAIELDAHTVTLLKANEIKAVNRAGWTIDDESAVEGYFMLGFPEDSHNRFAPIATPSGYTVGGNPVPSAWHVERIRNPDASLTQTAYPRFVGSLSNSEGDIVGMSGGPIFALSDRTYNVIAVQTGWYKGSRTSFGFYLSTIADLVEQELTRSRP